MLFLVFCLFLFVVVVVCLFFLRAHKHIEGNI